MIAAIYARKGYARKSTDESDRNAEARSTTRQIERATACQCGETALRRKLT
jgi:hypothetical protein